MYKAAKLYFAAHKTSNQLKMKKEKWKTKNKSQKIFLEIKIKAFKLFKMAIKLYFFFQVINASN